MEGWSCRFPVREPFTLAGVTIHEREYLVLRVTTDSGLAGASYALTRGEAFDAAVLRFAGTLLRLDIDEGLERLGLALDDSRADSRQGTRARSLLDIALWDIRGRAVEAPVWMLLADGRDPRAVPLMLVEGYPRVGEDDEAFASRLHGRTDEGFFWLKLAALPDADAMGRRLAATRSTVGGDVELVVDLGSAWNDLDLAVSAACRWADYRLSWLEDPFRRDRTDLTASLRRAAPVPVGAGDDALPHEILGLIEAEAVDVLRLDVTTVGGITGLAALRARIGALDRVISTHVYPEIHQHLALAWPDVRVIETFARGSLFDSSDRFVSHSSLRYENGLVTPPDGHGLGLQIDWDVVARQADRSFRLPA